MSGSASERVAVVTARARSLPALMYSNRLGRVGEEDLHLSAEQIGQRGRHAAIGHVHHVDAGHHLEQFGGDVGDPADAARTVGELARIGLGIGDELGNRLGRNRRIYHHDKGAADEARDRRDVADEIEIEFVVERRIDRVRRTDQEERVAVRRRAHDRLGGDIAAGARPVLDDEWLAEPLRQPLTDQAREDVVRAAGGKADDRCAPAATDRFAPTRRATWPEARQRPLPDAEIGGAEVSWRPPLVRAFARRTSLGRGSMRARSSEDRDAAMRA